jgi:4a-hydroxytetrahydrobiopterin dehydratase
MPLLSDAQIEEGLKRLPGWVRNGSALEREFTFETFALAMQFVNRVAGAAESANHHPDIDIRYARVKMSLTSHDSGGVTGRDLRLAEKIGQLL